MPEPAQPDAPGTDEETEPAIGSLGAARRRAQALLAQGRPVADRRRLRRVLRRLRALIEEVEEDMADGA
jgi:t-SNARE complex subunit (syntaxin)